MPARTKSFSDPIEKVSVVDQLAARLRARILRNDIKAGEQLRQEALAEAYGVSRMPIREALRQLEAEGLVVFNPHKGAIVSAMSVEEAEELFDLRLLIEPDLIARGAQAAIETDHAAASEALDRMNTAYDSEDAAHWGELNWSFHEALYTPAGRGRSLALVQSLNSKIDRYVRLQLSLEDSARDRAATEHQALLEAWMARDEDTLKTALADHIRFARDRVLDALRAQGDLDG